MSETLRESPNCSGIVASRNVSDFGIGQGQCVSPREGESWRRWQVTSADREGHGFESPQLGSGPRTPPMQACGRARGCRSRTVSVSRDFGPAGVTLRLPGHRTLIGHTFRARAGSRRSQILRAVRVPLTASATRLAASAQVKGCFMERRREISRSSLSVHGCRGPAVQIFRRQVTPQNPLRRGESQAPRRPRSGRPSDRRGLRPDVPRASSQDASAQVGSALIPRYWLRDPPRCPESVG